MIAFVWATMRQFNTSQASKVYCKVHSGYSSKTKRQHKKIASLISFVVPSWLFGEWL
eukprot:m.264867 g.264867  ORF g.264867 m.264867 type:complete len:57 (-) comp17625_c0_seq11:1515-1685(-)